MDEQLRDDLIVALDENLSTGLEIYDGDIVKAQHYAFNLIQAGELYSYTLQLKEEVYS
jgi:hypothetical protein